MEAKLEAVRGGISILNLTTDWLEWMEVETDDHKEMDKMMDGGHGGHDWYIDNGRRA